MRLRPARAGKRLCAGARSLVVLATLALLTAVAGLPPANATFSASTATSTSFTAYSLAAPTGLGASGTSTVTLSWTATTSGSASGTRVFRGTASGGPYTQIAQIAGLATTSTTDTPGTGTFYCVVEAYYNGGGANWTSPDSNQASITITPTPAFMRTVGTATCGDTSNTVTVPAGGVAAGHTLIVRLSNRGNNAGAVSASDSKGNTYTLDADILTFPSRTTVFSAYISTALVQNDTITVTHPSSSSESVAVGEFSGIASTNRVETASTATANTGTPSVSLTTTNANDLVYGTFAMQGNMTVTDPAGWTTHSFLSPSCGGGPGASTNSGAYRVASSTGTYTYNPTSNSNVWVAAIVAYKAG
jgi:hypothetical protein